MQQGQVFELRKRAVDGRPVWAYRYRTDGPSSRRLQRGGFSSERDAAEALERALEHLRRQKGVGSTLTLKELVEEYLAQYDAEPEIALAVAEGASNNEVAAALYVTPKTVEYHLTRIYRKLGLRSRAELVRQLASTESR